MKNNKGCAYTVRYVLDYISLGKYRPKLYHRGKADYASVTSGIMTILFIIFFLFFISKSFYDVFTLANYTTTSKSHLTANYLSPLTLVKDVSNIFDIDVYVEIDQEKTNKTCTDLSFEVDAIEGPNYLQEKRLKIHEYKN